MLRRASFALALAVGFVALNPYVGRTSRSASAGPEGPAYVRNIDPNDPNNYRARCWYVLLKLFRLLVTVKLPFGCTVTLIQYAGV